MDECNKKPLYKIEKRRVRIIIAKEDLFTLLVDSMTEAKYFPHYPGLQVLLSILAQVPTLRKRRVSNIQNSVRSWSIVLFPILTADLDTV
jgi:hypothetical protein